MKKLLTYTAVAAVMVVAALSLLTYGTAPKATAASLFRVDSDSILNYTAGSNYFYGAAGSSASTNAAATTGYTNTAVVVSTPTGAGLSFLVHVQGTVAAFSNNLTLVVKPAFGANTDDVSTLASGTYRIAIVPSGATAVTVVTNITPWLAPYAVVTLENPSGSNQTTPTNVVVRSWSKQN